MGESVRVFAEGLNRSLSAKAERLGLTMSAQMQSEALELNALIELLNQKLANSEDSRRHELEGLLGIVYLIRALMQPERNEISVRSDFELSVRTRAVRLDESMIRFEQIFESDQGDFLSERLRRAVAAAIEA
ncbi:MAG: hypothetical protein WDN10_03705 [bacterium]